MKQILLLLLTATAYTSTHAQVSIHDLQWITGHWETKGDGYAVYESWQAGPDSSYIGKGYVLIAGDTAVRELIKIEKIGNTLVYIAQVNGGTPVLFTLTAASTAQKLVFENKEHDNPQRIFYSYISANAMYAATEGTQKGHVERDEYPYVRR